MLINPVKATRMKYGKNIGLAGANDTCYEVCGAFSRSADPYNLDPACANECEKFINELKVELLGVDPCDHQFPYPPVIWDEVPNYVPMLIRKGNSPEEALEKCNKLCEKNSLALECQEKCKLHYNAIEVRPTVIPKQHPVKVKTIRENDKVDAETARNKWIIFGCLLFMILCIFIFVLRRQ